MKYFLYYILFFHTTILFSQSDNDLCENATEINTLTTTLDVFEMTDLTFDLSNGSCADDVDAGNFWFKFESHGSYFKFKPILSGETVQLSLYQFENEDCILDNATELACSDQFLEVFDLIDGDYYYVSMSTVPAFNDQVIIEIENPDDSPPPLNNNACDAITLNSDDCVFVDLLYADQNEIIPACFNTNLSDVWYKYKTEISSIGAQINLVSDGDFNELELKSLIFLSDCEKEYSLKSCHYNSGNQLRAISNRLTQNNTYYFSVFGADSIAENIELCIDPIFPFENDRPCDALAINHRDTLSSNTMNANYDITFSDFSCVYKTGHNLWYKLENEFEETTTYSIELSDVEFDNEGFWAIGYFEGNCSDDFIIVDSYCGEINNEIISYSSDSIGPKNYYFVLSSQAFSFGAFSLNYTIDVNFDFASNDTICNAYLLTDEYIEGNTLYSSSDIQSSCIQKPNSLWYTFEAPYSSFDSVGFISYDVNKGSNSAISISIGYLSSSCDQLEYEEVGVFCNLEEDGVLLFELQTGISQYFVNLSSEEYSEVEVRLKFNPRDPYDIPCFALPLNLNERTVIESSYSFPDIYMCGTFENSTWMSTDLVLSDSTTFGLLEFNPLDDPFSVYVGYFPDNCNSANFIVIDSICLSDESKLYFDLLAGVSQYHIALQQGRKYNNRTSVTLRTNRSNDFPCFAEEFDPFEWVRVANFYATQDLENCDDSENSVWHKIQLVHDSDMPDVELSYKNAYGTGDSTHMKVGYFPTDCEDGDFIELLELCEVQNESDTFFTTVQGVTDYHVIISSKRISSNGLFSFMIKGRALNDDICQAAELKNNETKIANSSLLDASLELCDSLFKDQWFYTDIAFSDSSQGAWITLNPVIPNNQLHANYAIGYLDMECDEEFMIIDQVCNFDSDTILNIEVPLGIDRLYHQFSSSQVGNSSVELNFSTYYCQSQESFMDAQIIGTQTRCYPGCNLLSKPDSTLITCDRENHGITWFAFDNSGFNRLSIYIDNADFPNPVLQIFKLDDQGNLEALTDCVSGGNGRAAIQNYIFEEQNRIYIAVSNGAGGPGFFELCILNRPLVFSCLDDQLEVVSTSLGSDFSGPYLPGEVVEFCYTLDDYTNDFFDCRRLHGIIPVFGDCWDPLFYSVNGEPKVTQAITPFSEYAEWGWFQDVSYNLTTNQITVKDFDGNGSLDMCNYQELGCSGEGITAGDTLPSGWFVYLDETGATDGNPNNSRGDGVECPSIEGPWTVCFELRTRTDSTIQFNNCDVSIYTTHDSESGAWDDSIFPDCFNTEPFLGCYSLKCTEGPALINTDDFFVCSGEKVIIDLQSDSSYTYINWKSSYETLPNSLKSGYGDLFSLDIDNYSDTILRIPFEIVLENEEGCQGPKTQIYINVYPSLSIDFGDIDSVCVDSPFTLGGSPTVFSYPDNSYDYFWLPGISENTSNPEVMINEPTTFILEVLDANGCVAIDSVDIGIWQNNMSILGEQSICLNDDLVIYSLTGDTNTDIQWKFVNEEVNSNELIIDPMLIGIGNFPIEVSFRDENSCFQILEGNIEVLALDNINLNYLGDTLFLCEAAGLSLYDLDKQEGAVYNWISSNSIITDDTIVVSEPGLYTVECINSSNCISTYNFYVSAETPTSIEFDGDFILCENEAGILSTTDDFLEYKWSNNSSESMISIQAGIYTLTATDYFGCTRIDSIEVTSYGIIDLSIDYPDSLCIYEKAEISTIGEYDTYEWSTDEMTNTITVGAGVYNLIVTDSNDCTTSQEFTIIEKESPMALFDFNQENLTYQFNNLSENSTQYFWDFGDSETSTETNPIHIYDNTGFYEVVLIALNSLCQDTFKTSIDVISSIQSPELPKKSIHIYPNPSNGDMILSFTSIKNERCEVEIFNHLGAQLETRELYIENRKTALKTDLASGIYFLRISFDNEIQLVKIVVL